jgi:hypothetical protein
VDTYQLVSPVSLQQLSAMSLVLERSRTFGTPSAHLCSSQVSISTSSCAANKRVQRTLNAVSGRHVGNVVSVMKEKGVSEVMLSRCCPLLLRCPSLSEVAASEKGPRELGPRGEHDRLQLGNTPIGTQSITALWSFNCNLMHVLGTAWSYKDSTTNVQGEGSFID